MFDIFITKVYQVDSKSRHLLIFQMFLKISDYQTIVNLHDFDSQILNNDQQLVCNLKSHAAWLARFCMGDDQLDGPCTGGVGFCMGLAWQLVTGHFYERTTRSAYI